ncbi:hypothetical protein WG904_04305 [Pedobacter sp. Du54]|uniref:hypothetical protein n=1 Tax=Pedobacter anseongensis TaxID=3133439 RepID=UPI0030A2F685
MLKLFTVIFCVFLCYSCSKHENNPLSIKFSADSATIVVSNIDAAALLKLKNNIKTDTTYQKLVSVLLTPADDDSTSMEREWPGKLSMKEDSVVFKPDSPFLKGKIYLVETKLNMSFGDVEQMIKGNVRARMNFQQQVLKR